MEPTIGTTTEGKPLAIDVDRLLVTRLLMQADSGGGKSWAIKRILEQTHGHVQQIIIDPEGEFSTLREQYDYLICAPEGADAIATPKTAAILARKLRETRVSAVIDIFDLRMQEQKHFVRLFIEELLAAPKKLWNPCLLVIDEAQVFAPEKEQAESLPAIMDLRGRGRKRGLCPILATPRLGQLSKDAAAGMQNKLIGVTTLDIDVARAARDLSLSPKDATELLRNLDPGEFYCFGPALTRAITKVKIGPIKTPHGQHTAGKDTRPPAPSEKIKSVIAKLTDLPKEAEQELRTTADLKNEISRLRREITIAKKEQPKTPATEIKRIEVPVVGKKAYVGIRESAAEMQKAMRKIREIQQAWQHNLDITDKRITELCATLEKVVALSPKAVVLDPAVIVHPQRPQPAHVAAGYVRAADFNKNWPGLQNGNIGKGEARVLTAIAQHSEGVTREQITVLTGYKRSTRDAYIQRLRLAGYVEERNDHIHATSAGVAQLGDGFAPLPTGPDLREYWLRKLPEGERKVLETLLTVFPSAPDRQHISDQTGFKRSTRDAYLQRLRSRQLIEISGTTVRASERLF